MQALLAEQEAVPPEEISENKESLGVRSLKAKSREHRLAHTQLSKLQLIDRQSLLRKLQGPRSR
jgi:hypothetical protein